MTKKMLEDVIKPINQQDKPVATLENMRKLYLQRLGVSATDGPSFDLLQRLQRAHVETIPYENLDVLEGHSVSLDPTDLFEKIIIGRRGGYCFELNTLFGWLLREIGFEIEFRMGRVWLRDPEEVPPRNHGTHIVRINGSEVIADVGFGGRAPRRPLDLAMLDQSIDDGDAAEEPLQLIEAGEYGLMVQRRIEGSWRNQFSLEPAAAHASDLEVANFYQSTAPSSHFRHHLFVGVFRKDGRDGLFDTRLSKRRGGETIIEFMKSVDQMASTLDEVFDIDPLPHLPVLEKILEQSAIG
jgi:N-hydroxyarylamine O-acetyltransferase